MKGGTRILAYEITVFLGSIPFITFLTWRARALGLNKRNAFFISIYLCGAVMAFPLALRLGWIIWWILSIIVLFILSIVRPKVLIDKTEDNAVTSKINVYAEISCFKEEFEQIQVNVVDPECLIETEEELGMLPIDEFIDLGFEDGYTVNNSNEEMNEPIQANMIDSESPVKTEEELGMLPIDTLIDLEFNDGCTENNSNEEKIEPIQVNMIDTESPVITVEKIDILSIDELLDLGFKEKDAKNFERAAFYFFHALSKEPFPDLAFSLIIDCYWLWNNLGKRNHALTQLQTFLQKYLPLFNPELCLEFDKWLIKEDIQIILE